MPERREPESELDREGIPDLAEGPPEQRAAGERPDDLLPPRDRPQGADEYGTTAAEQRRREPLRDRLRREVSEDAEQAADIDEPGQIEAMSPDADDEDQEVALESPRGSRALSPEEAAMHVEPERRSGR